MTSHPALPITGYKPLTQDQVDQMNAIKAQENALNTVLGDMMQAAPTDEARRWIAIARTHLETGFMFACKAVAQPAGGLGGGK
jgi:hypothetical protein